MTIVNSQKPPILNTRRTVMTIEELRQKLDETQYVYDDNMLTVV